MLKTEETSNPQSCWNKGRHDERMFVLLARDEASPATIRAWCAERIRLGKNQERDPQIDEALLCAALMEDERKRVNYKPHGGGMSGHDDDDGVELRAGGFYRSRAGFVWCCYRINEDAPEHAKALCIEVESGGKEYFFKDGRYDSAGKREHTLVMEVRP